MKKVWIRAGILFFIYILGVVGFSCLMNSQTTDNKTDLAVADIPCLAMKIGKSEVNRMYGYTENMKSEYMRDSVTPVGTDKTLTVSITPNGQKIKSLIYEIRTPDGTTVIENNKIKNFQKEADGRKTAEFTLQKPILMNQEYALSFLLETEEGSWNYYTRIIQRAGLSTEKYIEFVNEFYKKAFEKDSSLATYLESDSSVKNNSFNDLNIHSSLNMVTWGNLAPEISRPGIPTIKDINETAGSISVTYYITAEDSEGKIERYQVDDFYRMRYDQTRVRLLDFERSARQILTEQQKIVANGRLNLGITDSNIEYLADSKSSIIAFVQQGDLWSYNLETNKMVRIFSFRENGSNDERNEIPQHNIDIIRVTKEGDVDFVLYGYMNRGEHEGKSGTGVYHYSAAENAVEEKFFLKSKKPYEFLKEQVKDLCYVSEDNQLYLLIESTLYRINTEDKTYDVILENVNKDCFKVSENDRYVAWMDGMNPDNTTDVIFMDLETTKQSRIQAQNNQKIRLFGFINNDVIYGIANDGDIKTDVSGVTDFAMHKICIQSPEGKIVKNYSREGYYVMDVLVQENILELLRAEKMSEGYLRTNSDQIMNNVKDKQDQTFSVITTTIERQANVTAIEYGKGNSGQEPLMMDAKFMEPMNDNVLDMQVKDDGKEEYYTYAKGKLWGIFQNAADAVACADEQAGIVLNQSQQYIWERSSIKEKVEINPADIPEEFRKASLAIPKLKESLKDQGSVVDLTSCTLQQVLYELNSLRPVIVKAEDGKPKIMVGYDGYNTRLYDPDTEETSYFGMQDSTKLFETNGNVFICFIEKLEE